MSEIRLHSYFRSSTSVRVRVALAMKGLDYAYVPWNLLAGEQRSSAYLAVNPQGVVPVLEIDGLTLSAPCRRAWTTRTSPPAASR